MIEINNKTVVDIFSNGKYINRVYKGDKLVFQKSDDSIFLEDGGKILLETESNLKLESFGWKLLNIGGNHILTHDGLRLLVTE